MPSYLVIVKLVTYILYKVTLITLILNSVRNVSSNGFCGNIFAFNKLYCLLVL